MNIKNKKLQNKVSTSEVCVCVCVHIFFGQFFQSILKQSKIVEWYQKLKRSGIKKLTLTLWNSASNPVPVVAKNWKRVRKKKIETLYLYGEVTSKRQKLMREIGIYQRNFQAFVMGLLWIS